MEGNYKKIKNDSRHSDAQLSLTPRGVGFAEFYGHSYLIVEVGQRGVCIECAGIEKSGYLPTISVKKHPKFCTFAFFI